MPLVSLVIYGNCLFISVLLHAKFILKTLKEHLTFNFLFLLILIFLLSVLNEQLRIEEKVCSIIRGGCNLCQSEIHLIF